MSWRGRRAWPWVLLWSRWASLGREGRELPAVVPCCLWLSVAPQPARSCASGRLRAQGLCGYGPPSQLEPPGGGRGTWARGLWAPRGPALWSPQGKPPELPWGGRAVRPRGGPSLTAAPETGLKQPLGAGCFEQPQSAGNVVEAVEPSGAQAASTWQPGLPSCFPPAQEATCVLPTALRSHLHLQCPQPWWEPRCGEGPPGAQRDMC